MMNLIGFQQRQILAITVMMVCVVTSVGVTADLNDFTDFGLNPQRQRLDVVIDESHLINTNLDVDRVSVVNTNIASVQILEPREILVSGISVGKTSMIIWMDGYTVTYDVVVRMNTEQIHQAIQKVLPGEEIEVSPMKNSIALIGNVKDSTVVEKAMEIASAYTENVMNFLNVPGLSQILLQVKVAEVTRDFEQRLGIDFLVTDENVNAGSLLNGLVSGDDLGGGDIELGSAATAFFGLQKGDVFTFMQALERKGLVHILAEPNLLARSGETANFLAGGEIPVPVVQGGFSNSVSVQWKEFGVRLSFTPTLLSDGKIPLLGNLFKNRNSQATDTELLILVTPKLVAPLDGGPEKYLKPLSDQVKMDMIDVSDIPEHRKEQYRREHPENYMPNLSEQMMSEYETLDSVMVESEQLKAARITDQPETTADKPKTRSINRRNFYTD